MNQGRDDPAATRAILGGVRDVQPIEHGRRRDEQDRTESLDEALVVSVKRAGFAPVSPFCVSCRCGSAVF